MHEFMLLLYAEPAGDPEEARRREAELPLWVQLYESLRDEGVLVATGRLHGTEAATTVRERSGEVDVVDGPFATTKEVLAGYYLLRCADLDEALRHARRVPLVRYGSVEVRPLVEDPLASRA